MANLTVGVDGIDSIRRMQTLLSPALLTKAQAGGIAYASDAVPPAVAKGITAAYNITSTRIKQDIRGIRFNADKTEAIVGFSRRTPTLIQFKPSPGKRGRQRGLGRGMGWSAAIKPGTPLRATILRSQPRQPIANAFIATGASGNTVVLKRVGSKLVGVPTVSIGSLFLGQSKIGPALRATVEQRIGEQFIKGFDRVLGAAARGYGR